MPRVRVVIPTFNRASVVVGALESVLAQSYADFDVIVSDDGSNDDTLDRVLAFSRRDPRVHVLACTHGGVAAARNAALAEPGDHRYVAFLDSDDRWEPDHLEAAVAILDDEPAVALVFGAFETDDVTGTWSVQERRELAERVHRPVSLSARPHGRDGHILDVERTVSAFLRGTVHPKTSTVVVRRSSVPAGSWFDTSLAIMEDSDFYLRLVATRQPWAFIARKQSRVQFLGDNLTQTRDLSSPITRERLHCDLRFSRTRLGFCTGEVERAIARRAVADSAYLFGQSCAEQGLWPQARGAYRESLAARPTVLAATSLMGSVLPAALRRVITACRGRWRASTNV